MCKWATHEIGVDSTAEADTGTTTPSTRTSLPSRSVLTGAGGGLVPEGALASFAEGPVELPLLLFVSAGYGMELPSCSARECFCQAIHPVTAVAAAEISTSTQKYCQSIVRVDERGRRVCVINDAFPGPQ